MKFFVVILSLFIGLQSQAQDRSSDAQADGSEQAAPRGRYVVDESMQNRQGKQWQFDVNLMGVGPSLTGTGGLIGAYFLSPDQLILVELTSGSLGAGTNVDDDKVGSDYDITSKSIGVHYKQFTGNSFYFRAGGDFRSMNYKYSFTSANPADSSNMEFSGTSFALNFQIGNQWQWDNFTLGCDWVGVSIPVTSKVTEDRFVSNGIYSSIDRKQYNDDSKALVESSHLNLLRFYLGASF